MTLVSLPGAALRERHAGRSVLIIDDEPDVRGAMQRVLERAGLRVRTAENAELGIEEYRRAPTDLVITDIIMPKVNGVEAITTIRRQFPAARIIAISGGGNFGPLDYKPEAITTTAYLAASRQAGADAVLAKPFETHELLELVTATLDGVRGSSDAAS